MFIVVEMPIDLLMNLMALALLNLTTLGALGWFLLQGQAAPSNGAFMLKYHPHSEEPARVRAPPTVGLEVQDGSEGNWGRRNFVTFRG